MRARLLFVMIASGCAVSAATACSSPDVALEAEAKRATQASSVTVSMLDKSGKELGSCSGTLVAKDLVLTAGHCAAGAAKWTIDARGADATSSATRAVTPWKAFGSDLSHPDHSDVALLILDKPITLDAYPAIATSKLSDGAKALRFGRTAASSSEAGSTEIAVSGMAKKGFRLNYAAKIDKGGYLDTGGAIIDPKTGKIHGVISGVGNESGLLHIARVDNFAKWITKATSCMSATSLATRTYGTSSGGSSGWGGGGGDWGGYGGSGNKLDGGGASSGSSGSMDGGAGSSGSSSGSSGTAGSSSGTSGTSGTPGSSSGSSGTSGGSSGSSGSSGSDGNAGGGDTSGSGSSCPGVPTCEGSDCPGVPGGGAGGGGSSGSSGSDGTTGSSSGSSGAGASSGSSGAGASSGSSGAGASSGSSGAGGGDEVCPGPPNCPEPDSQACSGPACGGCGGVAGCIDATIDYGSCAACGSSNGTGTPPVVR